MNLSKNFDQEEHDKVVIECFSHLWKHSVDFMFIMAVEENGEFSLYDNNPASRTVMGLDKDLPIHRYNIRETWSDEVVEGLYATYRKAIEARKPVSFDQFATTGDSPVYVNTLFVPIFDENGLPLFVCGVSRDVSQIKAAEQIAVSANEKLKEYTQALENINDDLDNKVKTRTQELEKTTTDLKVALEAKSSFVSRVSHEIRTPINAMLGLSNLLKKTQLNDIQQDYVEKILDAGNVLMGVVNDILDFSKIEAEKLHPECIRFNPETTIRKAINISNFKAYDKGLELALYMDPVMPRHLMGDPLRIQQVIINLLSNAVKFTEQGSISLEVTYDTDSARTPFLQIAVTDTGIGISAEQQERLFIPFNQADNSITRHYGGTGLGLMISKKLCELMGGTITVNSQPGKGSCFTVRIPLENERNRPDNITLPNRSVLVVDEHPISLRLISKMLSEAGYLVGSAGNAAQAIEMAKQASIEGTPYDTVLLDRGVTGETPIKSILSTLHKYQITTPPVIMLSAYEKLAAQDDPDMDLVKCFLEKPSTPGALFQAIESDPEFSLNEWAPQAGKAPSRTTNLSAYTLLLVDDNPINQQVAAGFLKDSGIQIDIAGNGEDALEKVRRTSYDIILMDLQMPKLDGISATRHIRTHLNQSVPIIALTAHTNETTIRECLENGMSAHLSKPLDADTLYRVITDYLEANPASTNHTAAAEKSVMINTDTKLLFSQLASIEALNVKEALERLYHSEELFLSLIRSFYERYSDSLLLTQSTRELSLSQLTDEIHSLKSNCAYIGAQELSSACTILEQKLRSGETQVNADPIIYDLRELISCLHPLFCTESEVQQNSEQEKVSLKTCLTTMNTQLAQSDFRVEQTLAQIKSQLSGDKKSSEAIEYIGALVEEVEFEQALEASEPLIASLSSTGTVVDGK
ncbi:histidine kinase [Vibrio albus]|uniref:histidine kinase n=1 Tax=Vibrio albus TaxID=2200953 RepID=A0A2U3B6Y8_9VIBR|nr:response regulator [Vibrio albus]PWI32566.1 histidine kinase [Vibrio albus]